MGGRTTGLTLFLEAEAVAANTDHGGAVKEAIEGGGSHYSIAGEDLAHSLKALLLVTMIGWPLS